MNNRIEIIEETAQGHDDNPEQTRQLLSTTATAGTEVRRSSLKGANTNLDNFLGGEVVHGLEKNHQATLTDFK